MLKDSFIQYLQHERNFAPLSIRAYQSDLTAFDTWLMKELSISVFQAEDIGRISHKIIRQWMGNLADAGLEKRSIARKVSTLKSYFSFLHKRQYLEKNPAVSVKLPKFEKKLPAFLKEDEALALFSEEAFPDGFKGARDRCMIEILYGCGLRRAELIGLNRADVDLYEQSLHVRGKGGKERLVPFGKAVREAIQAYLQTTENEGIEIQSAFFVRKNSERIYPKLVYRVVQKHIQRVSSLSKQSPHVIRHTFATHLLDHGADLNAIKELLGHSSLAATQVYTHNTIQKLQQIHQQAHPRA